MRSPERGQVKVVITKSSEAKESQESSDKKSEPIFKNNFLKSLPKEESKTERKMSDFLIRKKVPYHDEKNTINLFNNVLSSLRKDRK